MTNQLSTIQFYGQSLITIEQDGKYYVAMRPICDNIGLDWAGQFSRIKRDEVLNSTVVIITTVADDNKKREMLCLPIEYLNGWLFGIDTKRVRLELRDTLIRYKKECYQVLHDYWHKQPSTPTIADRWIGDDTLQTLFDFLFLAHAQAVVLKDLYPALVQMMSKLHPEVYSLWTETSFVFNLKRNSLGDTLLLLAQESPKWKETLRHFNSLNTIKKSEPQTTKLSFR